MSLRAFRSLKAPLKSLRQGPIASTSRNAARSYSSEVVTEEIIKAKLTEALNPSSIKVMDTSGGCGSFFNIDIASKAFIGLSKVKQHKLVQDLLKSEVSNMHGLSLRTVVDEEDK